MDHLEKLFLAHGGKSHIESGKIERVRQGYYQYVGEDSFSDIPVIASLFPDAVICMESALDYYGYTDRTPAAWHLAVKSTSARNRFRIDYPCVRPHFVQEKRYPLGITTAVIDGTKLKSMIGNGRWWIFCFIETRWIVKCLIRLFSGIFVIRKRMRRS